MKKTSAALIFTSAALFLSGCNSQAEFEAWGAERAKATVYTIDPRTNICFASPGISDEQYFRSVTPCTPEVLQLVDGVRR